MSNGRGAFVLVKQGGVTALAGRPAPRSRSPLRRGGLRGRFAIAINTGTAAVLEHLTDADNNAVTIDLPVGSFLRVQGAGLSLAVLGQTLTGDFAFQMQTLADASRVITVAADNVVLSITDGTSRSSR